MLTLCFEECLFAKLDFAAYEKEKMTHSLQGKIVAEEGHVKTKRPLGRPADNDDSIGSSVRRQVGHGRDRHIVTRFQIEGDVQRSVRLQLMLAFH